MKRGYDRVRVIHGGFDEWVRRDLPTQPKPGETPLPATDIGGEIVPDRSA
jgi:3-mercaptopyruvate sulfurtransferase SseA